MDHGFIENFNDSAGGNLHTNHLDRFVLRPTGLQRFVAGMPKIRNFRLQLDAEIPAPSQVDPSVGGGDFSFVSDRMAYAFSYFQVSADTEQVEAESVSRAA
jgi:hypothetical protein